jgi:hypothetical protein
MFARVAVYEIPGHRMDEAVERFREALGQVTGMAEAYVLVSTESGRALTMTLWDQPNTMESSRMRATRLRGDAAKAVDGTVQSVVEYEVAIHERGS